MDFVTKFWSKVDRRGADECWLWLGGHTPAGYPAIWRDTRNYGAHRIALEFALGRALDNGMQACHRCDNPGCVNPQHLFEGTVKENRRDMFNKGRQPQWTRPPDELLPRGAKHWKARLTEASVREIRAMGAAHVSQRHIARLFGVDPSTVSKIVSGSEWRHVA
jgi:hypothetical protein